MDDISLGIMSKKRNKGNQFTTVISYYLFSFPSFSRLVEYKVLPVNLYSCIRTEFLYFLDMYVHRNSVQQRIMIAVIPFAA